jgi:hypothetical protein
MSLQQAKKLAEVREQIDAAGNKLALLNDGFRKQMNEDITNDFRNHLEVNGFQVSTTPSGAEAVYKDLKITLVLLKPDERYIGIYHAFDTVVNGRTNDVRVIPDFTGVPARQSFRSGDSLSLLEEDLANIKEEVENVKLQSYKFDCTKKGNKPGAADMKKNTIAEVIDLFTA